MKKDQSYAADFHDYSRVGTYHITITTEPRRPLFGIIRHEPQPQSVSIINFFSFISSRKKTHHLDIFLTKKL